MSRPLGIGVTVWLAVFALVVVGLNHSTPDWYGLYELTEHGRHVEATITGLEPQNHATCSYSFTVKGVEYHGSEQSCAEALGKNTRIGDHIQITYAADDPTVSTWGTTGDQLAFRTGFAFLVPTLMAWFAFYAAKRNARWPMKSSA